MADDTMSGSGTITRVNRRKSEGSDYPMMSFTAVTTHQSMAEAFVHELIRTGQRIMPDHDLSIADIYSICRIALKERAPGVVILEGRHLRGRVSEQISRANRYKETFSILVMHQTDKSDLITYEAMVDTLCERMRDTDLLFLFKARIVLVLPHTDLNACKQLNDRVQNLLDEAMDKKPDVEFKSLTYPNPDIDKAMRVLDWVEDQLRH